MVTFGMVQEAYKIYGRLSNKAAEFYENGGRGEYYYQLEREADEAFENYKELTEILEGGGYYD